MTNKSGDGGCSSTAQQRLAGVRLRVTSVPELAAFYTDYLGMTVEYKGEVACLGYGGEGAQLELQPLVSDLAYQHGKLDEYWKIGITLPNIDIACSNLRYAGIEVSQPRQFMDIGYLCHLQDPHGHCIELLQHTFEGQPRTAEGNAALPLGGGAQIGQITLRTCDIESSLQTYVQESGMRLLSVQEVKDFNFSLYFLAFTNDEIPNNDLFSAANRPWLYQRPYTTLELQVLADNTQALRKKNEDEPGFAGLSFC